jgi:alkylation response protein AidB-like acyl-CoA dehydrogenase
MYLTEEQSAFVDSIRRMVERHIAPIASEIDETDRFPEELVPIFGDMGLLQQWVPEEYGGPGGNLTMLCLAKHEIAKVSMACSILAGQNSMGMVLPVLHFGSEEQKRRFLPLAAKGRTLTAVAMSEPHCGSDVAAMKTKAVRDGSSYVINGQKCFITFGSVADWVMLFARTSEGRGVDGISAFMVDTKTPGFKVGRNERKMGLGGVPNVQLFFEDMCVPVENRLGEEGQGFLLHHEHISERAAGGGSYECRAMRKGDRTHGGLYAPASSLRSVAVGSAGGTQQDRVAGGEIGGGAFTGLFLCADDR